MDREVAEAAAEILLLVDGQILVAEEDHQVFHQRIVHLLELLVAERARQVDPADFGPDMRRQLFDRDRLVGHRSLPLSDLANDTRRIADRKAARRQVAGDDAAGADDAAVADRHAGEDYRAAADPYAAADADRPRHLPSGDALGAVEWVGGRVELNRRTHLQIVADLDRRAVEEDAVEVDKGAVADPDVGPVVASEGRLDIRGIADRAQ